MSELRPNTLGKMCDLCGASDPRVPLELGQIRGIPAWICAICKAEYLRWLR